MTSNTRCLVYFNINNSKNTQKGQAKLCSTAYIKDKCRCINCKEFAYIKQNNYRKNNLEKIRKYHREYSKKNPIKIKEYSDKNKKRIAKDIDKYKQKRKEYNDRYKNANPEKIKELWRNKDRKRRATIRKNGYERYTEFDVLKTYGSVCYLCMGEIDLNSTRIVGFPGWEYGLHIEHYVDIALGGPDTLENVRPAHAICNLKKKPKEMV
jgi:hypothetical protein